MSPTSAEITYREMIASDIPAGQALCEAAGWNQVARDWMQFLHLSPRGCRVAVRNHEVIGTATTVNYENRFAWIGMVLVDPAVRRQGVGARLLGETLAILRDNPCARLDATPAGHAVYLKLGFVDEYEISRMQVTLPDVGCLAAHNPARPLTRADLPAVLALDHEVFGADRGPLLRWMLEGAPGYAWAVTENDMVAGYCLGRSGQRYEHIGPVVARDQRMAQMLVSACLAGQQGHPCLVDAPAVNTEWIAWLTHAGFTRQRTLTRMYRGEHRWPGTPEKLFAILGPEFG
ncbi:MAG: GNAT family N-acetyltransferase [Blastocatellia bacterium]